MDDESMRKALLKKLSDPQWKAEQERRYRKIMGGAEIAFSAPPPRRRESIRQPDLPMPREEEPATVEALWLGNWQRSSGALTITRYPDDTIVLPGCKDCGPKAKSSFRPRIWLGPGKWKVGGCEPCAELE